MKNNYFDTCELCGATLDPGEKCNCKEEEAKELQKVTERETTGNGLHQLQKTA